MCFVLSVILPGWILSSWLCWDDWWKGASVCSHQDSQHSQTRWLFFFFNNLWCIHGWSFIIHHHSFVWKTL